ncbi:hypothetical protein HK100_010624 [Physocladia obscura]|uniref:Enoyl reductase (ER) domain-containing protein n=1 Tax=Physocladia obscura TaxID=109957 RepID=A0AAD5T2B9_9FUNG|nr:hypothetical protein HK100_010624 [Physocladia obscura]
MVKNTAEIVYAVGVTNSTEKLRLIEIPRREVGETDVRIKIQYTGICHSDLHFICQEWGPLEFPAVAGQEIVGIVTNVGSGVSKHKIGDAVGVGCSVDSCRICTNCSRYAEPYCKNRVVETYHSPTDDAVGHTLGGYSQAIVVDEEFVLSIPKNLDLAGNHVAVLGLGGLGHMGLLLSNNAISKKKKFPPILNSCQACSGSAQKSQSSRSSGRTEDAYKLGASNVIITSDTAAFQAATDTVDYILDTVSAKHDIDALITLLKTDGKLVEVLLVEIKETQEMLDFCGKHGITSAIELISVNKTEQTFERILKSDVKFRFVLDIAGTLNKDTVIEEI